MLIVVVLLSLIAAGVVYQRIGTYRDIGKYAAPGRLVDAGCVRLHLNEQGEGQPVVVLESGIGATSLSWALVQPRIAEFTRVCSYDRAGLGWSARCLAPRTVDQMVSEFETLLRAAKLPGPYILVGHSFGGLLIRAYAHLRPHQVSGLVLIDPVSLDYWANCDNEGRRRLQLGVKLSRRGALLARLGIVRLALAAAASGQRRFPKILARATARQQGTSFMERMAGEIRKLPPAVWPMIRANWSTPKSFEALALYLEALPGNARAVLEMPVPEEIPVMIFSATDATEEEIRERETWVRESRNGRHVRLGQSGHWIQLEHPDIVIDAVRGLVDQRRQTAKTPQRLNSH